MTVDIVNYNNRTHHGLLNINIPDNNCYSFDNVFIKNEDKLISVYDFFNRREIYTITKNNMLHNQCNAKGLYLIEYINADNNKIAILRKINEDESELIANIDCNSNYIVTDTCKLYKAGNFDKNLYYCYECGKYIWD